MYHLTIKIACTKNQQHIALGHCCNRTFQKISTQQHTKCTQAARDTEKPSDLRILAYSQTLIPFAQLSHFLILFTVRTCTMFSLFLLCDFKNVLCVYVGSVFVKFLDHQQPQNFTLMKCFVIYDSKIFPAQITGIEVY